MIDNYQREIEKSYAIKDPYVYLLFEEYYNEDCGQRFTNTVAVFDSKFLADEGLKEYDDFITNVATAGAEGKRSYKEYCEVILDIAKWKINTIDN